MTTCAFSCLAPNTLPPSPQETTCSLLVRAAVVGKTPNQVKAEREGKRGSVTSLSSVLLAQISPNAGTHLIKGLLTMNAAGSLQLGRTCQQ